MRQLISFLFIVLTVFISFKACSETKLKLKLTFDNDVLFFSAENWSHENSTRMVSMCFDKKNGIELGKYKNGKFVKLDRMAQVNFGCDIYSLKNIKAYEIVGTFVSKRLIEDVYKTDLALEDFGFRICFEQECVYSNILSKAG